MNRIERKPVVDKFELRRSRPLPNVYRLSRHAQLVSELCISCKHICQAAHARRLVRTYLVPTFTRNGLSAWCKKNLFFKFLKDIPNERNALDHTENTCMTCQKLATKIKAFQSAFEVQDLAANGTCRQITLLTLIDALSSRYLLYLTVC